MITITDTVTLRILPSRTGTDDFGHPVNSGDVVSIETEGQVIAHKDDDQAITDNTEIIRLQVRYPVDILDLTKLQVVFRGQTYKVLKTNRSPVIQPSVLKLTCQLIREVL